MRAIDADALEELFREVIGGIAKRPEMNGNLEHMVRASAMTVQMIQDAPTVEPEERKAEWGTLPQGPGMASLFTCVCTACHEPYDSHTRYCPNCGARMEGIP